MNTKNEKAGRCFECGAPTYDSSVTRCLQCNMSRPEKLEVSAGGITGAEVWIRWHDTPHNNNQMTRLETEDARLLLKKLQELLPRVGYCPACGDAINTNEVSDLIKL